MLETKLIMFRHEKHFFCPSGFSVSQPSSPCGKMDASLQWQREHQVLAALLQRMLSTNPISETFLFPEAGIFTAAAFPTLLDTAPAIALPTEVILQGYFWFVNGKNAAFRRPFQHIFFSPPFATQLAPYFGIHWGEKPDPSCAGWLGAVASDVCSWTELDFWCIFAPKLPLRRTPTTCISQLWPGELGMVRELLLPSLWDQSRAFSRGSELHVTNCF